MKRSFYTIGSLVILLIAAFVFVLVPIFAGGNGGNRLPAFGKYDGTEIRFQEGSDFNNYLSQYDNYYKNQGIEINSSNMYYIYAYAFNSAVTQLAFEKEVAKSGYKVPAGAVNRALMPYFTDETGKYSDKLYRLADKSQVAKLRANFEKSLTTSRFQADMFGGEVAGKKSLYGLKTSDAEVEFLKNLNTTKRTLKTAAFDMSKYPDSEKAAFGKANAGKFVKFNYSVVNYDSKAKADSVAKKLSNGEMTIQEANADSLKSFATPDGKLTNQFSYQLEKIITNSDDFAQVSSLEKGAVSSAVKTSVGYSVFVADHAAVQPDFKDEALLRSINNYITSTEYSVIEDYFKGQAESFIKMAKESGFDAACKKFDVKSNTVKAFPLNYGNVSIADTLDTSIEGLSGANTNENFLKTAFKLAKGEVSAPVTNGRNIVVMQLVSETTTPSDMANDALTDELANYDSQALQTAILTSPKLVNNVDKVYFNYIAR